MSAAQACSGHFLPRNGFGKPTLRDCRTQKRDNIVLIEVDSDDFGDVIILDVPESFQQKFRKKPKHVISIDDDDDDNDAGGGGSGESRVGACDTNGNAAASNRFSPTSVSHSSNSANVDGDFVSEGSVPVKLSKSKRTYSGKNISRNRYGLSADSESYLSESDCSDCECMGDSFGKLHEQSVKATFRQRHGTSSGPSGFQNIIGRSAPSQPVHNSAEEVTSQQSEPLGQPSNSSDSSLNHGKMEKASLRRRHGTSSGPSDVENKSGTSAPSQPGHNSAERSEFPVRQNNSSNSSLNHDGDDTLSDSSEGQFARKRDGSSGLSDLNYDGTSVPECPVQQGAKESVGEPLETHYKEMNEVFTQSCSANVSKDPAHEDVESNHPVLFERGQGVEGPSISSDVIFGYGIENEALFPCQQSNIITDRQKFKETDEYKLAMEEEWASRQQQLQRQAEEARRLRDRKKAEKMRIMVNEQRQKQRLEEIRDTRRKDEENLNMKEKLRVEIRKELRKLEMCGDMASLLRCLGIQIGGGFYPSPNEVQAAYKRACLKFHPDRISASDLQQQVEAEEKFKLISNMKDKFLLK